MADALTPVERPDGPVGTPVVGASDAVPLCVDLDGTLIAADLSLESLFYALRVRPLLVFLLPIWLLRGRAFLKQRLAQHACLDVADLPFNSVVVDLMRAATNAGRSVTVATGSEATLAARAIAASGLAADLLGTTGHTNLVGRAKAAALVARHGAGGFDYVGNASADLPVWASARTAYVFGTEALARRARAVNANTVLLPFARPLLRVVLARALRVHQWAKNLLVFVPLLAAHRFDDARALTAAVAAFVALCLVASATYLINDAFDLQADRRHPSKRRRPLAAGTLPLISVVVLAPLLAAAGIALTANMLPALATWLLLAYLATTLIYSATLKLQAILDVLALALVFSLRVQIGGAATDIPVSSWLLALSMFMFLSLAAAKRVTELQNLAASGGATRRARGYGVEDVPLLQSMGISSGLLAALLMALYVESDIVRSLYAMPEALLCTIPVLVYWILRIWTLASRGTLDEDPIIFALRDPPSWLALLALLLVFAVATGVPRAV